MQELKNISYTAGKKNILNNISLSFTKQAFNVIVGANGAGKTTLLKIATGLLNPTQGEVLLQSKSITHYTTEQLALHRVVLSQAYDIVFPMLVKDVVMMGRYPYFKHSPSKIDFKIVEYVLEKVGMTQQINQNYLTLSGGEKQKVQLARVLAQIWNEKDAPSDKYLFLDEPISNLDVKYQLEILELTKELTKHNITIVAILHDINLLLQFGDAFYFLKEGYLIKQTNNKKDIDETLLHTIFDVNANKITDISTKKEMWMFEKNKSYRNL